MYHKIVIFAIFATCASLPLEDDKGVDCEQGILNPMCLKIGAITLIEKLSARDEITILPGVIIVKEINNKTEEENAEEKEKRTTDLKETLTGNNDGKLDKYLLKRIGNFLDTHAVKMKFLDEGTIPPKKATEVLAEARARRGGKKGGGLGSLIAIAMMMKGTMMSIGIGALALLAGKALMTAMMSLLLSAVVGIKSLSSGQKSTTYEIVSKPIYTHSHSHSTAHEDVGGGYGHSGYGRSLNVRKR